MPNPGYDAVKTVEAFSAALRNEVDLKQLSEHLITVVQETMQPAHISLWLLPANPDSTQQTAWRSIPPVSLTENEEVERFEDKRDMLVRVKVKPFSSRIVCGD